MGRVANPQLRSEWQARLERWQRSGLGVREFCAGEDVGEPAFYQWRKKLGVYSPDGYGRAAVRTRSHYCSLWYLCGIDRRAHVENDRILIAGPK